MQQTMKGLVSLGYFQLFLDGLYSRQSHSNRISLQHQRRRNHTIIVRDKTITDWGSNIIWTGTDKKGFYSLKLIRWIRNHWEGKLKRMKQGDEHADHTNLWHSHMQKSCLSFAYFYAWNSVGFCQIGNRSRTSQWCPLATGRAAAYFELSPHPGCRKRCKENITLWMHYAPCKQVE